MSKSKLILNQISKVIEQGLYNYKDLSEEFISILRSKRDELIYKLKITSNEETEVLIRRIEKLEMLDHVKMNTPGKEKFRTLADSVRRAIQLCNPLKVPTSGYERWKNMILNFDARDMLGG